MGKNTFGGIYDGFFPISPHPFKKNLRNFINEISLTLSKNLRKPHVQDKSSSGYIVGTLF